MKRRRKTKNRVCSMALALLLIISVCSPVSAATARATTMKLESTTGTVTLKTQNGASRKITKGMRLYNGYTLETGASSYAYVSLDSSKAAKLDAKSKAALRQSGKQLELFVKSGKLFFNVKTPLSSSESMNIRTSTMVTGVRGTCGVVEVVSNEKSTLHLLEGKVSFTTTDPQTGVQQTVMVTGGQIATMEKTAEGAETISVASMSEEEVPLFAIEEVVKDPDLQEKIERTTDLQVQKMADYMQQQIQGDDTANGTQNDGSGSKDDAQAGDGSKDNNSTNNNTQPGSSANSGTQTQPGSSTNTGTQTQPGSSTNTGTQTQPGSSAGNSGNTSGSSTNTGTQPGNSGNQGSQPGDINQGQVTKPETPANPPETPEIPVTPTNPSETPNPSEETSYVLKGAISAEQLMDALKQHDDVTIAGTINITSEKEVSIEEGKVLRIAKDAVMTIAEKASVSGKGKMADVKGKIENNGEIKIGSIQMDGGEIVNNRVIELRDGMTGKYTYTIKNEGTYGDDSVLCCGNKATSTDQQQEARMNAHLLAVGEKYSGSQDSTNVKYIYASCLNQNVADKMNDSNTEHIKWLFQKNAVVQMAKEVKLKQFSADLKEHEVEVIGKLMVENGTLVGSGNAVVHITTNGALRLADIPTGATGMIRNDNQAGGYGIQIDDMSVVNSGLYLGSNWYVGALSDDKIIQGVKVSHNGTSVLVDIKKPYMEVKAGTGIISYMESNMHCYVYYE